MPARPTAKEARQPLHALLPTATKASTARIAACQHAVAVDKDKDKDILLDALALRHGHYLSQRDVPVLCAAPAPTSVRPTNPP